MEALASAFGVASSEGWSAARARGQASATAQDINGIEALASMR
jgi:hypothetical protein